MHDPHVPGQYLGYSLQASRFLDHLLKGSPGVVVSLEVLGDTAIQSADGEMTVEELKSRTTDDSPIRNRAPDLWKTFHNWIVAIKSGTLPIETTRFRLFVTREFDSNFAKRLSDARDTAGIDTLIEEMRGELLEGRKALAIDSALRKHVEVVLAAPRDMVLGLFRNFVLECGTGRSWDELRATIESHFIPPDIQDDVLRWMGGWLQQQINSRIESGEPASIAWEDFRNATITLVGRFDKQALFRMPRREPSQAAIEQQIESLATYIRQLDLIESDHEDKLAAATEYLMAAAERVELAKRGHVLPDSLVAFERELKRSWQNFRLHCETAHERRPEVDRGKLLYSDCCGHRVALDDRDAPPWFCRGAFHKLADAKMVGWHPRYATLLSATE